MLAQVRAELRDRINPEKAAFFPRFFKTGVGQYGEGDRFLGITVPDQRAVAKRHKQLPLADIKKLLDSKWHEERLTALLIMVYQFKANSHVPARQKELYDFYLANTQQINNWDLVDTSARDIVGGYIYNHQDQLAQLDKLADSNVLWERRIAILASYYFLMKGEPDVTIRLSKKLIHDEHDLMHKAVGWMLREMGKRCDQQVLRDFLDNHAHEMPRTMLGYAIEHFDTIIRTQYLRQTKPAQSR